MVCVAYVAPNFFEFMNMPMQAGVALRTANEIVVSNTFEKNFGKEVLGQVFYDWSQKGYTVTGVCSPLSGSVSQRNVSSDYDPTT